jgi:glyoxylase-like metal-dependent hydrolase (beta-lactamase superfamily II)
MNQPPHQPSDPNNQPVPPANQSDPKEASNYEYLKVQQAREDAERLRYDRQRIKGAQQRMLFARIDTMFMFLKKFCSLLRPTLIFSLVVAILTVGCIMLTSPPSQGQTQDFSKVEIQTVPVRDNVYMLMGEGGNIGVSIGSDGVFLVDDQFAPLTEKIKIAIAALTDQPVRLLLNTHWHFDHTGGNENLGKSGVLILAHDQVRERMSKGQSVPVLNMQIPAYPVAALPLVTYKEGVTLHLNGDTIEAIHVDPAHTDGDTFLHWLKTDVIHAGDIYFNGLYPFIDTSSNGSIKGMIAAVDRLLEIAGSQTKIIPGHGPLSNKFELETYRQMLLVAQGRTTAAITLGKTVEEFIASKPMAEFDAKWGTGFLSPEQFLKIVYTSVEQDLKNAG